MKIETKVNIYNTLFMSIFFGVVFTIVGGLIINGAVDWYNFPVEALVGVVVGFIVGMVIPIGKWGAAVASKVAKPGTFLFNLILYTVLLLIILLFMCPILTLFIGCVIMGAPVEAILPNLYSLFIPFFLIAIVILMLIGGYIMKLSMKCAGVPDAANAGVSNEGNQEKL